VFIPDRHRFEGLGIMATMNTSITSVPKHLNPPIRLPSGKPFGGIAIAALAFAALFLAPCALRADPSLSGAIFTTDSTCTEVNVNSYADKDDVYIDGGPAHPGAAGLPDGSYCVQVTDPSGQTVLGLSDPGAVTVSGGEFVECYQLTAILKTASSGFTNPGFDDTPNPGGEYKVWVSTDCNFDNNNSKTDNFQVEAECEKATLFVSAFYDTNANGVKDGGEEDMAGWRFRVFSHDNLQITRQTPRELHVQVGTYTMIEHNPLEPNWVHSNAKEVECTMAEYDYLVMSFGNVYLGGGGAYSLSFWSSKNGGQALTTSDDLAFLSSLYLRNTKGTDYNPPTSRSLGNWQASATKTNMAYMLSAQLSAMELNVLHGFVNGGALVYAPTLSPCGTVAGLNSAGFITVNDLMAAAAAEIQAHAKTDSSSPYRACQEALNGALDDANNNKTFVQSLSGPFTFE
jgi:hypothetical protein